MYVNCTVQSPLMERLQSLLMERRTHVIGAGQPTPAPRHFPGDLKIASINHKTPRNIPVGLTDATPPS